MVFLYCYVVDPLAQQQSLISSLQMFSVALSSCPYYTPFKVFSLANICIREEGFYLQFIEVVINYQPLAVNFLAGGKFNLLRG